jgi:hypothetical protein
MKSRKICGSHPAHADDEKRREKDAERETSRIACEAASDLTALEIDRQNPSTSRQNLDAQEPDVALLTLDTIARGSLSIVSFERYVAYKQALLVGDKDLIALSLAIFIQDLFSGSSSTTLH